MGKDINNTRGLFYVAPRNSVGTGCVRIYYLMLLAFLTG